jgi:hypothetical protein
VKYKKFGSIFQEKFKKNPEDMTLMEIEKTAIKEPKFLKYAQNLIGSRGNVFQNKKYKNIDEAIDAKLGT